MKPGIIKRFEAYKATLEATVKRLIQKFCGGVGQKGSSLLVGTIIAFSGDMEGPHPIDPVTRQVDTGYALCDGKTYFSSSLGGMIETPDLRDRFIMGSGAKFLPGQTGGEEASEHEVEISPTTLTIEQIPSHTHSMGHTLYGTSPSRYVCLREPSSKSFANFSWTSYTGGGQSHTHSGSFTVAPEDKLTPYLALCYLVKI